MARSLRRRCIWLGGDTYAGLYIAPRPIDGVLLVRVV